MPPPFEPLKLKTRSLNIRPDQLLHRYLRVQLTPTAQKGAEFIDAQAPPQKIALNNQIIIRSTDSEKRYASHGHCIYCGATEFEPSSRRGLSAEHVLAAGWGGTLILEGASCRKCQKHINENFEGAILGGSFLALRRRLKIGGKKRKNGQRESDFEVLTMVEGKDVRLRLPLEEHPTVLFLVGLTAPRMIGGPGGPGLIYVHTFESHSAAKKRGIDNVISPSIDTVRFCQMLAKIAHGYAVLRVGGNKFRPYLQDFILRKFKKDEPYPDCYNWVGGHSKFVGATEPDELHQLGHQIFEHNGKKLLVVGIRLLANLGAPLYWVVVGEID